MIKNAPFIFRVNHLRSKKGAVKNAEAMQYWFSKIKDVESKIERITVAPG